MSETDLKRDHHPGCYSIDPPTSGNWECNCGYGSQRKIAELEAEVEREATKADEWMEKCIQTEGRASQAEAERDRLREALREIRQLSSEFEIGLIVEKALSTDA